MEKLILTKILGRRSPLDDRHNASLRCLSIWDYETFDVIEFKLRPVNRCETKPQRYQSPVIIGTYTCSCITPYFHTHDSTAKFTDKALNFQQSHILPFLWLMMIAFPLDVQKTNSFGERA